jgi:hypothetical protein
MRAYIKEIETKKNPYKEITKHKAGCWKKIKQD